MIDAVRLDSVSKIYKSRRMRYQIRALQNVTLKIPPKTLTVLHGPNGSGKSTILKILATLSIPTVGVAYVFNNDVTKSPNVVRSIMGFLPENLSPPTDITAYEYLNVLGHLRKISSGLQLRIDELLHKVRLFRWKDVPIQTYSRGMQQRLGFAQTMLGDPDLYLLDEPLSALDISGRTMLIDVIKELKNAGKTIIISTHRDEYFRDFTDQVIILENGLILDEVNTEV